MKNRKYLAVYFKKRTADILFKFHKTEKKEIPLNKLLNSLILDQVSKLTKNKILLEDINSAKRELETEVEI